MKIHVERIESDVSFIHHGMKMVVYYQIDEEAREALERLYRDGNVRGNKMTSFFTNSINHVLGLELKTEAEITAAIERQQNDPLFGIFA